MAFKTVSNIGTDPIVQKKFLNLETEFQNMPTLVKVGSWNALKRLMIVEAWFKKTVVENYNHIQSACLNE